MAPEGLLSTITDGDGNVTLVQRDASGIPSMIVGPYGHVTGLSTDADGNLSAVVDPLGHTSAFTYWPGALMKVFTDPRGNDHNFTFDALGRLALDQDPAGGLHALGRTQSGDTTTVTKTTALGVATSYELTRSTDAGESRVNTFADGTSASEITANDQTKTVTTPDGTTVTERVSPDPRFGILTPIPMLTTKTPSGLTRTESRTRSVTLADPNDPFSFTSQTDAVSVNGRTTTTVFSKANRQETVTSPAGRLTTRYYDPQMRVTRREVAGILPIDFVYDARGRLSTITQGTRVRGTSHFNTVDHRNGYVQSVTNALNQTTQFEPDALGRILQQIEPDTATTGFDWDAASNLTSVTPPGQPAHGQAFTPVDLLSSYTPPTVPGVPSPATIYAYNVDRQLTQTTRPDGLLIGRTYDAGGKLDLLTTPTGTVDYDYFGLTPCAGCAPGRLSRISDPSGVVVDFSYDGFLQTGFKWSGAVNGQVNFGYDSSFRVTSETVTVGGTVSTVVFGYDPDDIFICASPSTCSPAGADALKVTLDAGNGLVTGSTLGVVIDTVTYNDYGELASYAATVGNTLVFSQVVDTASAPRDALGRIVTRTEFNGGAGWTDTYSYDVRGRLTDVYRDGALYEHYEYDPNGNRVLLQKPGSSATGVYDGQDRLLSYGQWAFTYTANGELRTKTDAVTSEVTTYSYDARGNLVRVDLPSGDWIEYLVDGENRRVGKKKNGVLEKQWFYRNGLSIIAELDGAGVLVARFVYGAKSNVPQYMVRAGVVYRILSDHLGSPRAVVDVTTGGVVWRADYDAWGRRSVHTGAEDFFPVGFAGGIFDTETGLVRFGARDYDSMLGRWTTKDPIFSGGEPNAFLYAKADSINSRDIFGTTTCKECVQKCLETTEICHINCDTGIASTPLPDSDQGPTTGPGSACEEEKGKCPPCKDPNKDKKKCFKQCDDEFETCRAKCLKKYDDCTQ